MRFLKSPWLQLAVVILIAFSGIVGAVDNVQDPYALVCILGLMALGLAGIGLGELRGGAGVSRSFSGQELQENLEAKRAQLDHTSWIISPVSFSRISMRPAAIPNPSPKQAAA
jgi:hypothetical protein